MWSSALHRLSTTTHHIPPVLRSIHPHAIEIYIHAPTLPTTPYIRQLFTSSTGHRLTPGLLFPAVTTLHHTTLKCTRKRQRAFNRTSATTSNNSNASSRHSPSVPATLPYFFTHQAATPHKLLTASSGHHQPFHKATENTQTTLNGGSDDDAERSNKNFIPLQSTENQRFAAVGSSILRWLIHYLWPHPIADRLRVVASFGCLVLSKVIITQAPILLGCLVNTMAAANVASPDFVLPALLIAAYPMARIAASGLNELRNVLFTTVSQSACRIIACNSFSNLHRREIDFLITNKSGEIAAIIRRGVKGVTQLLNMMLFQVVPTIFEFGLVLYVMASSVGASAAAITSVTMLAYVLFTLYVTSKRTEIRRKMNGAEQAAAGLLQESLTNAEVIRYFTSEKEELRRYEREQRNYENESVRVNVSLAFLNFGQQTIFNLGLLGCLYLTVLQIMSGAAPIGNLAMISTLLFQLAIPLHLVGSLFREVHLNVIDLQKLHELLHSDETMNPEDGADFQFKEGHIKFDDVTFEYNSSVKSALQSQPTIYDDKASETGPSVLKNLSFDVKPGTKVAIVGPSGSGKSTLLKLLFRLYDVQNGGVYLDGQNVKDLNLPSFRKHIGVVPQEVLLFNESILYNLKYGSPNATFEDVQAAVRLAQLEDVIAALPEQYETMVGERGIKLSGGEKQRVGVARCILRNPSIIVLDEATSALDVTTERQVSQALREICKNRTVLVIAHRLSTVIDADKILMLGNGRVEEEGTHQELLDRPNSKYRELWRNK